tara:strand:- start:120 stop:860 length:741 start_codon:yes stop_codon:yes gene_type:complete
MSSKIGLNSTRYYSINFDLPKRSKKFIKFIIIHYTGMEKEADALNKLCDSKSKVSSHYFIKNNGKILNLVPDLYTAWHAGKSNWRNLKSLNKYSIGIEIHNPGHNFKYRNFSSKQIFSVIKLIKFLVKKYKIKKSNILGHSDISPDRKKDPGEKFPWKKLAKKQLCVWHNLKSSKLKKFRNLKLNLNEEKTFFKNLGRIGYAVKKKNISTNSGKILIQAFQRKFRNNLINGKIDQECLIISKNIKD